MLARLFDADRASLLTRLLLEAIAAFDIDTSRLHTDTTSIRFAGAYPDADGRSRGGKPTPSITRGHSKDHRPDLKQLVWSLTVSADGAVPICHRVADGNTNDDVLHIPTWDQLVALLGRVDFLYVADCKLASRDNTDHIRRLGGRFLTVLPASRSGSRSAESESGPFPIPRVGVLQAIMVHIESSSVGGVVRTGEEPEDLPPGIHGLRLPVRRRVVVDEPCPAPS